MNLCDQVDLLTRRKRQLIGGVKEKDFLAPTPNPGNKKPNTKVPFVPACAHRKPLRYSITTAELKIAPRSGAGASGNNPKPTGLGRAQSLFSIEGKVVKKRTQMRNDLRNPIPELSGVWEKQAEGEQKSENKCFFEDCLRNIATPRGLTELVVSLYLYSPCRLFSYRTIFY